MVEKKILHSEITNEELKWGSKKEEEERAARGRSGCFCLFVSHRFEKSILLF